MKTWKSVPEYEGFYEISDSGNIRNKKGLLLKPYFSGKGYLSIELYKNGKKERNYVHRLVALTFLPKIENKNEVNHKNGIKTDNSLKNLEWMNRSENVRHGYENSLYKKGEEHYNAKLTDKAVEFIRKNYIPRSSSFGRNALAEKFGVHPRYIYDVVHSLTRT